MPEPGGTDARDRAAGALLGLACGDAVGTTLEFRSPGSFEPIDDMVGGGPFRLAPGEWTDDTSMALCLAESIVDTGGLDLADQLRRYVLWYRDGYLGSNGQCFDIGGTTRTQLQRFERTGEPVDPHVDEDAAANGSLMRLAAVPIRWWTDPAEAAERSGESSRTTHAADRPVDTCRWLGAVIADLIGGADFDEAVDGNRGLDLHPAVAAVVAGSWRTKEPPAIRGNGYCVDALEAALWAVGGAGSYREAVLRAANLGDDADTTAAVAGQLAGARWGASGIPAPWREQVVLADRIVAMANRLHDAAAGVGPVTPWPHDEALHAWWVEPGSVLAGEYPGHPDPYRAALKVNLLVDAGVRTIVDLTTADDGLVPYDDHLAVAADRRRLALRRVHVPIPDLGVTTDAEYDRALAAVAEGRERGGVYIHCWGGVGRTGTVAGCLLLDGGDHGGDVLARLAELRAGTRKAHRPAPETRSQLDVLRRRTGRSG